jgi:hypothetical protein
MRWWATGFLQFLPLKEASTRKPTTAGHLFFQQDQVSNVTRSFIPTKEPYLSATYSTTPHRHQQNLITPQTAITSTPSIRRNLWNKWLVAARLAGFPVYDGGVGGKKANLGVIKFTTKFYAKTLHLKFNKNHKTKLISHII